MHNWANASSSVSFQTNFEPFEWAIFAILLVRHSSTLTALVVQLCARIWPSLLVSVLANYSVSTPPPYPSRLLLCPCIVTHFVTRFACLCVIVFARRSRRRHERRSAIDARRFAQDHHHCRFDSWCFTSCPQCGSRSLLPDSKT